MDNFLGEIRMFAGSYAPQNWHYCDGSTLQISQYEALFTLLGTTYGGNGQTTFGLPDLRGRAPVHKGTGTGLAPVVLGQMGGSETATLTAANLPPHAHVLTAVNAPAATNTPTTNSMLSTTTPVAYVTNTSTPPAPLPTPVAMYGASIGYSGANLPVSIVQPSMAIGFIIALTGIFPPQN
ncbi:phage tail protein [Mucilaginibacter mali]|uniref:Phage tail protein n=1 Tax=Mucilaginibacter mali TaxID=2740462 RepID=A0A7D4TQ47_9SPHI|nr:tail fiber protein [Mucilaginibacter mali]QKJ31114.1 phage tail protein [Mucilaginibacter mali]